jgi:hypothetical protein
MIIKMIEQKVVQSYEVFIVTFYRAQYRLYRQTLRNLIFRDSTMLDVQVRTMNFMQRCQRSFIFLDLMTCQRLSFMRIKNRVNVIYFKTEYVMMIVENVDQIMKKQLKHRLHFENVFDHVKLLEASITVIETKRNFCLSLLLSRADVVD